MKQLFIYRCTRCCATFSVESLDEKYGPQKQSEALEANGCKVCGKGALELVGPIAVFDLEVTR